MERECVGDFVLFRGQRRDWPLLPKVARSKLRSSISSEETAMLKKFKAKAPPLLQYFPGGDWEWVAIAQHHGMPTRFLDWTRNPLAALWFAIREAPARDEDGALESGVVWVLDYAEADVVQNLEVEGSPLTNRKTRIYEPRYVDTRIKAQAGVFTAHVLNKRDGKESFVPFERHLKFDGRLRKLIVEPTSFRAMRNALHRCGVCAETLYGDLTGLAETIGWEHADDGDVVGSK
ncbi:MAG: FRG domain-containing protein [Myxococcota bacterium]